MIQIGLVYNNDLKGPTQGGGFSIQEELINNIDKIRDENIQLNLICLNINNELIIKHKNKFEKILHLKRNIYDKFRENLIRNFSFFSERGNYLSQLDKLCVKNNLDLIIFLDDIHTIKTNFPYVTNVYDVDHLIYSFFPEHSKKNKWYKRENNYRNHLRKASGIISGTECGIKQIKEYYGIPSNKLFKIPHPAIKPKKDFEENKKYIEKLGLRRNKFLFYPAQFWAHKNHKSLINLAQKIKNDAKIDIKIVLSGSDKGNLDFIKQQINEKDLNDVIKYIGFINRSELFTLYKNCLALSYVSYGGPENLPPLEAFSVGCPVIATKNTGSIEQLEDGAILIDPDNSDEFIESIVKLQNEKYKDDLIKKGKKISEKKSIDNFMIELKSLILSLKKYIDTWKNV